MCKCPTDDSSVLRKTKNSRRPLFFLFFTFHPRGAVGGSGFLPAGCFTTVEIFIKNPKIQNPTSFLDIPWSLDTWEDFDFTSRFGLFWRTFIQPNMFDRAWDMFLSNLCNRQVNIAFISTNHSPKQAPYDHDVPHFTLFGPVPTGLQRWCIHSAAAAVPQRMHEDVRKYLRHVLYLHLRALQQPYCQACFL